MLLLQIRVDLGMVPHTFFFFDFNSGWQCIAVATSSLLILWGGLPGGFAPTCPFQFRKRPGSVCTASQGCHAAHSFRSCFRARTASDDTEKKNGSTLLKTQELSYQGPHYRMQLKVLPCNNIILTGNSPKHVL